MQRAMKWALSLLGSAAILFGGFVVLHGSLPPASINAWLPAGNLAAARAGAASVLLQDGRLLITGGNGASGALASTEILDPATGFTAGPAMSIARSNHVAVLLVDGRVLVAGGTGADGRASQSAELFDPVANSWSASGPLMVGRSGATATLLPSGQVLIAGGTANGAALASLELFDPSANTFSLVAGTLSSPRENHAAALLPDGRVLIAGGWDGTTLAPVPPASTGTANVLTSTDIFDPSTGAVAPGPALTAPRMNFTATAALDGTVAGIGGTDGVNDLASIDILAPGAGAFALSGTQLATARQGHLAFLLPHNGNILVVGGTSGGTAVSAVELYTPWTGATSVTGAMASARSAATGSPLSQMVLTAPVGIEGALLVAGGVDASSPPATLPSAEVYGFATVRSDKGDYAPGETAIISGSGWQPGEVVQMSLVEVPDLDNDSPIPLTATADASGNISNVTVPIDVADLNIRFTLTAVGAVSQAQTTFTDSVSFSSVTAGAQTPNPVVKGNPASYSIGVNFSGNGSTGCSVTLSVITAGGQTGLPTGASPSFGTNPVTSTGSDGSSTLTISTNGTTTPAGTYTFTVQGVAPVVGGGQGCGGGTKTVAATLVVVGPATHLQVETAANGSGTVLGPTNVTSGASVTGYAIERDASNNFVANVAASWSLVNTTGGVVSGDLVPSVDMKSAVFTGHVVGTAQMQASADTFTGTSGTLTVVAGSATQLAFLQQPTNTQAGSTISPAVTVQLLDAAGNLTSDTGTPIQIVIANNPSAGTLSGTTSIASASGLVTYSDLSINNAGNAYTLRAQHGGLTSATSNQFNITSATPLTVTINQAAGQVDPTNTSPINFTVVFSAAVSDFATGDVTLGGTAGPTTQLVTGSGTTYNVAVSGMTSDGTVTASIAAGVAHDASSNANQASTSTDPTVSYDTTLPTATITAHPNDPSNSASPSFSFSTTDPPSNGYASGVNHAECKVDSGMYTTCTSPDVLSPPLVDGSHTFYVRAVDNAGNTGTAVSFTWTIDTAPLTVTINQAAAQADPTNTSPINFTAVFNKSVSDFATGDVSFTGSTAPGTLAGAVTGSGTTYNVAVTGMTGDGTVVASIAADVAHDAANNGNQASTSTDQTVTYDTTKPTATITSHPTDPSNDPNPSFSFTTNDPLSNGVASGVDHAECRIDGGSYATCTSPKSFTTLADGSHTFNVRAVDKAGNVGDPDSFTWTIDTKPPVVNVTLPSVDGLNGWFVHSPVAATVTATDPSKVDSISCTINGSPAPLSGTTGLNTTSASGTLNVSGDGTHNVSCTATDSLGNSGADTGSDNTPTVKIDTTPPSTTYVNRTPAPNGFGWNNSDVTVNWSCTDATSGPLNPSISQTVSTQGANQSSTGTCHDYAGLTASDTQTGINIDKTNPTVSIIVPGDGTNYTLGQAVPANFSCADQALLSGIDTCVGTVATGTNIDTSTVGNKSFTVTATDKAGNTASQTVHYNVVYNFTGFLPPIANLPILNSAKGGQTIPIKWQLSDANGNIISDLGTLSNMNLVPIACSGGYVMTLPNDTVDTTGGTVFRFDGTQFIYNWKTSKGWNGCLELRVTLKDGTVHAADFQFK